MLIKNMTNSRLDIWHGGKKKVIRVGEIVDLPAKFIESGVGKNLKKQKRIVVIEDKTTSAVSEDSKKTKPKK